MMQENERLRKEAKSKEAELEKLKSLLRQRDEQLEQLKSQPKSDKSISGRMADTKLRDAYNEIDKKNQLLSAAKDSLKESALREQALTIEKQQLLAQLAQSQPSNDKRLLADAKRLEAENRQLHSELDRLKGPGVPPTQTLLERLRSLDAVLNENVDLKLQLKEARNQADKVSDVVHRWNFN